MTRVAHVPSPLSPSSGRWGDNTETSACEMGGGRLLHGRGRWRHEGPLRQFLADVGDATAIYAQAKWARCAIIAMPDGIQTFYRIERRQRTTVGFLGDRAPSKDGTMTAQDMINRAFFRMSYLISPVKQRCRNADTVRPVDGERRLKNVGRRKLA